jgi:hypothetical protein
MLFSVHSPCINIYVVEWKCMSVTEYNDDTSLMQLEIIKQLERAKQVTRLSL